MDHGLLDYGLCCTDVPLALLKRRCHVERPLQTGLLAAAQGVRERFEDSGRPRQEPPVKINHTKESLYTV
jgi:hypothetical protein